MKILQAYTFNKKMTVLQQNIIICIDMKHQDYLPTQTEVSNGRQFIKVGLCL